MTTVNDILIRARLRIGQHANEQAYPPVEQAEDFNMLTAMLNAWALNTIISSFTAPAFTDQVTLTFADDTTLTYEAELALVANLAIRLAGIYELPISQDIVLDAELGMQGIHRKQHLALSADQTYDTTLSNMPSQRRF